MSLILFVLPVGGCASLGNYYGGYYAYCPALDRPQIRAETKHVAEIVSARLDRGLTLIRPNFKYEDPSYALGAGQGPAIGVSDNTQFEPRYIFVSVSKTGGDEDANTRAAKSIIEATLKTSACPHWDYRLSHFSMAKG